MTHREIAAKRTTSPSGAPERGAEFWNDPDITDAFANRHMGKVVAAYRSHPSHRRPIPQEVVADWAGMTQPQLSRFENGPPSKDLDKLAFWARTLRIPPERLWFDLPEHGRRLASRAPRGHTPAALPPRFAPADDTRSDVGERLNTTVDDLARIPFVGDDGRITWASVDRKAFVQQSAGAVTAAYLKDLAPSVVLADAPDPVSRFTAQRRALVDHDNLLGPHDVIVAALRQLSSVQRARDLAHGVDRSKLLVVQSEYAEFLSWLYHDAGDHANAQYWLDRSLEWAHVTGNSDAVVYVLARKSQLAADMRQPGTAVDTAEAAIRLAPPDSRLAAVASTYAAHGYALDGNEVEAERHYERAYEVAQSAILLDSLFGLFLDEAYISAYRAHSLALLGRFDDSLSIYESTVADVRPAYYRDRGVYLSRHAVALAGAGDIERAASTGMQALAIGTETRSGRTMVDLDRLDRMLRQAGSESEFQSTMQAIRSHSNAGDEPS